MDHSAVPAEKPEQLHFRSKIIVQFSGQINSRQNACSLPLTTHWVHYLSVTCATSGPVSGYQERLIFLHVSSFPYL